MKLYVVQNSQGQFLNKGEQSKYEAHWKDNLEQAKLYSKIGPARGRVTYLFNRFPEFGCPQILEFDLKTQDAKVISEEEDTKKKIKKHKEKRELEIQQQEYNLAKWSFKMAWCRVRKINPSDGWDMAEKAWNESQKT